MEAVAEDDLSELLGMDEEEASGLVDQDLSSSPTEEEKEEPPEPFAEGLGEDLAMEASDESLDLEEEEFSGNLESEETAGAFTPDTFGPDEGEEEGFLGEDLGQDLSPEQDHEAPEVSMGGLEDDEDSPRLLEEDLSEAFLMEEDEGIVEEDLRQTEQEGPVLSEKDLTEETAFQEAPVLSEDYEEPVGSAPMPPEETPDLDESEEISTTEPLQQSIGLSEEKLEALITRVVEDVVERVARESMTNVAEKLITEAIDALKESLQSSTDPSS
jgi:hypothetical protein